MFDKVILAAIREEYNAATPAASRSEIGFLRFAVGFVYTVFYENDDDACFDWKASLVKKHAAAILAHNPEAVKDDDLDLLFEDWDLED